MFAFLDTSWCRLLKWWFFFYEDKGLIIWFGMVSGLSAMVADVLRMKEAKAFETMVLIQIILMEYS